MAYEAPSAPDSFYQPTLDAMVARMTATARLVLIDNSALDPNACWAQVGVADDSNDVTGANMGTSVLGYAELGAQPVISDGDEEGVDEAGRKLTFAAVANAPIVQTQVGSSVAIALVDDVATFAAGNDTNVAYIVAMQSLAVDGSPGGVTINVPGFDIEIQYATNK